MTTSIESKRGDREFRRLDIEIDVLLELLDYSDVYNEKDIIDRVHEKYEPLHKIIIDNITNSLTSLDDLPKFNIKGTYQIKKTDFSISVLLQRFIKYYI